MSHDTREAVSISFRRRKANAAFLRDAVDWDVWVYDEPEFRNVYDRGVTLHVEQGEAKLRFSTGEEVDLKAVTS